MSRHRVVAIDIGNSNTDLALFENSTLLIHDFLPSAAEYIDKICQITETWYQNQGMGHVIIASVVPALGDLLETIIETRLALKPTMVEDFKTNLLPLLVDRPETVGVDRIVNCYAALHLYGSPAIVVSLGTATTFEAISEKGEYVGGIIAPGVKISLEALTQRTALLPPAVWKKPNHIIAKNTLEHMQSGIYYGTIGLIEGIVKRMKPLLGEHTRVIGTGGISSVIAQEGVFDSHDPLLTLRGLELIHRHRC